LTTQQAALLFSLPNSSSWSQYCHQHSEISKVTIYLIRHAQSAFNAVYDPNKPDPMILDAPITALGKAQAQQAQSEVKQLDLINVIVSPFTRTLQTAHLIFGNRLPFQINSEVREQLCNSCDVGSPPHKLAKDYPHLDFGHLDDCWWHDGEKDHRGISVEPEEVLLERAKVSTPRQLSLMVISFER
jgi:broad specificity phosphatase PhoE